MRTPKIVFCGGGTGGHLTPALAVLEELMAQLGALDAVFLTPGRPADYKLLDGVPARHRVVTAPRRPSRLLGWPMAAARGYSALTSCIEELSSADLALGTGGYASGPGILAARLLGVPYAILEPNLRTGQANRFFAGRAAAVFAPSGVWGLPPNARQIPVTCPVRSRFRIADTRVEARASLGLPVNSTVLLVMGGSQGSEALNRATAAQAGTLAAAGCAVLLLTGSEGPVSETLKRAGLTAVVRPFAADMERMFDASDLVLARAGASTLAEIAARGRPAVLVPLAGSADGHQEANARAAEAAGWARVLTQDRLAADGLAAVLELLAVRPYGPERLSGMAEAARRAAQPQAAAVVAGELVRLWRARERQEQVAASA